MNRFKGFFAFVIIIELLLLVLGNLLYVMETRDTKNRLYRVEAKRVIRQLEETNIYPIDVENLDLSGYETIIRVSPFREEEACNHDYVVEAFAGELYRIEYQATQNYRPLLYINGILIAMMIVTVVMLSYIYQKVLKPFQSMSNLSYELAKGNLSAPVHEEKSKLFGKFLWGMDMLREKLEDNKEKELEFQKERKTLILSLSHDIKTPLASIDLYTKALTDNLYDTKEKQDEALQGIARNVQEIKGYVDEIVTASREDFLNLEVCEGEYYLSEVMKAIEVYYHNKLSIVHTEFVVEEYEDCLIKGDKNRMIEVLQNIMENAIKYGDGTGIRIAVDEEEDCKLISVENSGCDIKQEELPNLFDSFYRGSNSHGIKGNGLGLYICKTLMKKMDGDIFAHIQDDRFCMTVVARKV